MVGLGRASQEGRGIHSVEKLLGILRVSPLGRLPLHDAFKVDGYHHTRKQANESLWAYTVREQATFLDLERALKRLREERQRKLKSKRQEQGQDLGG